MTHLETPAKINLWLKVVGLRQDGYHLLNTLMVPISLFDQIQVQETPDQDEITYIVKGQTTPIEGDILQKTLKKIRQNHQVPPLKITVNKNIPMGAGLGGGSSNAGALLSYLHTHFQVPMATITKLAPEIGADVPFFINPTPAIATGIGENLKPVAVTPMWLVVAKPNFSMSTPEVFKQFDASSPQNQESTNNDTLNQFDINNLPPLLTNDLEQAASHINPQVTQLKSALQEQGAAGSLMSGSGSSVFGLFLDESRAEKAQKNLQKAYANYDLYMCRTLG